MSMQSFTEYGIQTLPNTPLLFIPDAVTAFNGLVESVRGDDAKEPVSATEKAVRASLLANVSDEGKAIVEKVSDLLLSVDDGDALYVLTEVRRALVGTENDAEFSVYEGVRNTKDDGASADSSLSATFEFLKNSIAASFEIAKMVGDDAALIARTKAVEKENTRRSKINAKETDESKHLPMIHAPLRLKGKDDPEWVPNRLNSPQGLDDGKKGGRKAATSKYGWIVSDGADGSIEVPAGTPVPELLSRYLRTVTLKEFVTAWSAADRVAKEKKEENENRLLTFPDGSTALAVHPNNMKAEEAAE
jgi:hypothetical protein